MKTVKMMVKTSLIATALATLFGGCVNLDKPTAQRNFYMLNTSEIPLPTNIVPMDGKPLLQIQNFSIASPFARREFVYRTRDDLYESDYFNAFFINPADLLNERITLSLADSPSFNILFPGLDRLHADYVLDGYITRLYGDFRDLKQPKAALGLALYLIKVSKPNPHVVMGKIYMRKIPIAKRTPENLVQGWNQALKEILKDIHVDISHVLK